MGSGMRFEGTIKSWDESRGFGFIASTNGGQDVFIHVSALPRGTGTPRIGQPFSFEVELNREGKKRATRVQHVGRSAGPRRVRRRERNARNPFAAVAGAVLVVALAAAAYGKFSGQFARFMAPGPAAAAQAYEPSHVEPASLPTSSFRCDGRTLCREMKSCAEATFFLRNCPGVKMDGNHDGVPCEQQWCTSASAR